MAKDEEETAGSGSEPGQSKPTSRLEQARAAAKADAAPVHHHWLTRRRFLLAGGVAVGVTAAGIVTLRQMSSGPLEGEAELELPAEMVGYPKKKIAKLSELVTDKPTMFHYPYDDLNSLSFIVKLGVAAGAGVGPQKDVVAFSTLCAHMGGDMTGKYLKDHKIAGPCPLHLTTFDLTRYGMVVAGQATESLPQVLLEATGDDVYATGILGLIYGKRDNLDVPEV